jgi:RNA polymerase sigma-70 factor (ECF subfamily)
MTQDNTTHTEQLYRLLSQSALGDRIAFQQLYDLTSPKLYALCLRILVRRDLAEEALQEAFINIWHHAQNYRPDKSAVMTWLTTIVRNKAFDVLRQHPTEADETQDEVLLNLFSPESGPMEQLASKHESDALQRCMQVLSPLQRQAIALCYFHGFTHEQLAAHLTQPLGSIKTWVRRGLISLKACLTGAKS